MQKEIYISNNREKRLIWLIEQMIKEKETGHKCYYLGSKYSYKQMLYNLDKCGRKDIELLYIDKESSPGSSLDKVFTNDLTWEVASIFPIAVRNLIGMNNTWYITINSEGAKVDAQ